jgi:hypothetical protein
MSDNIKEAAKGGDEEDKVSDDEPKLRGAYSCRRSKKNMSNMGA